MNWILLMKSHFRHGQHEAVFCLQRVRQAAIAMEKFVKGFHVSPLMAS
jgi:hypothetical protein